MAANTSDFFGEGVYGAQKGPAPRPVSADGLTFTDTGEPTPEYHRRQEAIRASGDAAARNRQLLLDTGQKTQAPAPGKWGPASTTASRAATVNAPNDHLSDVARLGGAALNMLYPVQTVTRPYVGEAGRAVLDPIGYGSSAIADEALDTVLPRGSGMFGDNIIPGVSGTGGDTMFPSENAMTGDYASGYRGVGNPRTNPTGPQATNVGGGGAQPPAAGVPSEVQRPDAYRSQPIATPDQYRSDDVMAELRAMFAGESRQGPSEAEVLALQATDRAAANALGIAAGARGGAGARARAGQQALAANASMGSQATGQVAALRAREDAERRQRQQQIMGLISGAAQAGDTRDLGYTQAESARLGDLDRLDLGYTQTETQDRQSAASLANTAYQQTADRELRRDTFNAGQPVGFADDPLGSIFERLFGGQLRSAPRV